MTDTYNGWKNWQTWNVNLWLSNEEPHYRAVLAADLDRADDLERLARTRMPGGTPDMEGPHEYEDVDWSAILQGFKEDIEA